MERSALIKLCENLKIELDTNNEMLCDYAHLFINSEVEELKDTIEKYSEVLLTIYIRDEKKGGKHKAFKYTLFCLKYLHINTISKI